MNTIGNEETATRFELFELRLRDSGRSMTEFAPTRGIRAEDSTRSIRGSLWPPRHPARLQMREFWENVTYGMLWICGLAGIVLSWA